MARKDLEEQVSTELAKELAQELDRQMMWGWLKEAGWVHVKLSRYRDNMHAIDIRIWIEENRTDEILTAGCEFLFKNPKDATMFILRFAS